MGTFYLGLSMAGTVSAGTFTGGTLAELNIWLATWQKARRDGITLMTQKDTATYKKGDSIRIEPQEIPNHTVKIKAITGASGGGVSAAIYLSGLTLNKSEEMLRDIWTNIDVRDMLNNDDLSNNKSIYSLLNVKPIDEMMHQLLNQKWDTTNYASEIEYLDDNVEVFLTLGSFEGIPYKTTPFIGNGVSYGIHKTHLDYIKFNFSKNGNAAPPKPNLPFAYNLVYNPNIAFGDDASWKQLILSAPATAAFPFGFKARTLKRYRNEYIGKLFYLNYTNPTATIDYSTLQTAWPPETIPNESFDMEYMDGGAFNREPHDLARASIIESLNIGGKKIPSDGTKTNATVILVDPFPSNFDAQKKPGDVVKGIPTLFQLPENVLGSMLDQGRFRPDWIEKALDDKYYSRFLISPTRRDANQVVQDVPLAAGFLGAFSGFIDKSYREHDYKLGHYNTYQFLNANFSVPIDNVEIDYCRTASPALLEKYEALGWYDKENSHCQIIPRMIEPNLLNSMQPTWPTISKDRWEEVYSLALDRAKALEHSATSFGLLDGVADFVIWKLIKGKIEDQLDKIEQILVDNKLVRK